MSFSVKTVLVLFLLVSVNAFGGSELRATSPSGILLDRTLTLAHLEAMDGRAAGSVVNLPRFRQALFELERSASIDLAWPEARAMAQQALAKAPANAIPLSLVYARYHRLDQQQRLRSGEVFAFAPLREKTYYGGRLRFSIAATDMLQHDTAAVQELWFDAGDGLGYRLLEPGEMLEASYAQTGIKNLRLQVTLADGSSLEAASELDVVQLTTPDPTATWPITASQQWQGVAGTGQAYIYLAEGHSAVTNPAVVVEGFDIDNSIDWPVLYDLLNQENLLEDLRSAGYDAVVLDFTESVDPVERNAFVLTELLQMVNATTPPGTSSVLIGASMGGLVSRYGLLWMEQQNITHGVRTWITFDAPHNGADIPLGVQEWVVFFADQSADAEYLVSRLNAPASRQMLLYHQLSTAGTTAKPDPLKAVLDQEFSGMGGWPQAPRRVSIVNGSGLMANQGFNAGDQVIQYEFSNFLVTIKGNIWAVPDGGSTKIFDGLLDPLIGASSSRQLTISGSLPWDNAPGGSRNTMQQLASVTAPYGDITALHNSHCFIPTVSALALASNNPFYDVNGDANLRDNTPFDQVYVPAANQEHIEITPENKLWFLGEIQSGITVSLISGDTSEGDGTATFTIAAQFPPTAPVTISLQSSNPGEGSVATNVVLPAGSTTPQPVVVTGVEDAVLDGSVMYQIITGATSSADKAYDGIDPADVAVTNLDNDNEVIFSNGFEPLATGHPAGHCCSDSVKMKHNELRAPPSPAVTRL